MLKDIVSDELKLMLGKLIHVGYNITKQIKNAHEVFGTSVGRETLPYVRRAAIEFVMDKYAQTVENLKANYSPNKSGNSHHVRLNYDDRLIITVNHLASINGVIQDIPRQAIFRGMLSKSNPDQYFLFPHSVEECFSSGKKIHATLIHKGRETPVYVALIVLNTQCNTIIDNLPINIAEHVNKTDVNIIDDLTPEFIEFVKKNYKG